MKKIKVIFLGSRPLGSYALDFLGKMPNVEVVGCVVRSPAEESWWVSDPFHLVSSKKISLEDIGSIDFDLGVSINYWSIIPESIISRAKLGFVNVHHSYLLSLKGRDMQTHAILNARKNNSWYHGTTLHYINENLDSGPIIASDSCDITEYDTAWTLFNKVEQLSKDLIKIWLPRIVLSNPPTASPQHKIQDAVKFRRDLPSSLISDLRADPIFSYDVVRAFDFNGNYEMASTFINGERVYLTTNRSMSKDLLLILDETRYIYSVNLNNKKWMK